MSRLIFKKSRGQILLIPFMLGIVGMVFWARPWLTRRSATAELKASWAQGKWVLVYNGGSSNKELRSVGVDQISRPLAGFESIDRDPTSYGYDISPDFKRLVWIDSHFRLKLAWDQQNKSAEWTPSKDGEIDGPMFDRDGSIFFLLRSPKTAKWPGTLWRLKIKDGRFMHADPVDIPFSLSSRAEISRDGSLLAGIDGHGKLHVSHRSPTGTFDSDQTIFGSTPDEFMLAPNGSWLAVREGRSLFRYDLASGSRQKLGEADSIDAISPDGRWLIVRDFFMYEVSAWYALRVADGTRLEMRLSNDDDHYRNGTAGGPMLWISRSE